MKHSDEQTQFRVVALVGSDSAATRNTLEALYGVDGVEIAAVLLECGAVAKGRRWKNFRRNVKREGWSYPIWRLMGAVSEWLEARSAAAADAGQVERWMGEAFAGESFTLDQWALRRGVALHRLENLNSAECGGLLEGLGADLGIVIGTRILKRSTFAKPRLGSLNLHKGKVPEYRGMPPGFWEIYDRAQSAGVTVHFVDDGLDTGNIVATAELGIRQTETPDTLRRKMDEAGARLMAEAVAKVRDGETQGQRQPSGKWPLRTRPTRLQVLELSRRGGPLERLAKALPYEIVKRVFYLLLWKLGVVGLMRRLGRKPQAAILLYHRVDDFSDDPLTISRRGFAEHLSVLKRFYTVRSSEWLVERLEKGESIGSDTVVLHFDDCYESVASAAAPLLRAAGLPATSFINSGFIDTARRFGHDERKYALDYANMSSEQVRGLESQGVGVAAHTVNHVDMGAIGPDEALRELRDGREALEGLLGREVKLFSFPYGRPENVNARVIEQAKACGYRAVFSAHGGYVEGNCDLYDIPRIGISQYHSPLELLLELEGLTLSRVKQVLTGGRSRCGF